MRKLILLSLMTVVEIPGSAKAQSRGRSGSTPKRCANSATIFPRRARRDRGDVRQERRDLREARPQLREDRQDRRRSQ